MNMKRSERLYQYGYVRHKMELAYTDRAREIQEAVLTSGSFGPQACLTMEGKGKTEAIELGYRMAQRYFALACLGLVRGDKDGAEMLYLKFLVKLEAKVRANPSDSFFLYSGKIQFARNLRREQADKVFSKKTVTA